MGDSDDEESDSSSGEDEPKAKPQKGVRFADPPADNKQHKLYGTKTQVLSKGDIVSEPSSGDASVVVEGRADWKIGSRVEVYSRTKDEWSPGEIKDFTEDAEGEWITVIYGQNRTKETQRYYDDIRPITVNADVTALSEDQQQKLLQNFEEESNMNSTNPVGAHSPESQI
eukprot:UN01988